MMMDDDVKLEHIDMNLEEMKIDEQGMTNMRMNMGGQGSNMAKKMITIRSLLDAPHQFVISGTTSVKSLEQMIRYSFGLCPDSMIRLFCAMGEEPIFALVSMEHVLSPSSGDTFYVMFDKRMPVVLPSEHHMVYLREPMAKNPSMMFNPINVELEKMSPMAATMHINMPMDVQLRRLPCTNRDVYLLDIKVKTTYGLNSPIHERNAWVMSNFRLRMKEISGHNPHLSLHSHQEPDMDLGEMKERRAEGDHRPMLPSKEPMKRLGSNCMYHPCAFRLVEEPNPPMVPLETAAESSSRRDNNEEKMLDLNKEREQTWDKAKTMAPKYTRVDGYVEWTMDHHKMKESSVCTMDNTFVQTYLFEVKNNQPVHEPIHYVFDIIGEVTAQYGGDMSSSQGAEETFEVVQGKPLMCNPGRRRIAAVQEIRMCVDIYPEAAAACCYKEKEAIPFMFSALPRMNLNEFGMALDPKENSHHRQNGSGMGPNFHQLRPDMETMDDHEKDLELRRNRETMDLRQSVEIREPLENGEKREDEKESSNNKGKSPLPKFLDHVLNRDQNAAKKKKKSKGKKSGNGSGTGKEMGKTETGHEMAGSASS